MASYAHHTPTFEDAWQLWEEVESGAGTSLEVRLWRPRALQGDQRYPAQVAVTIVRTKQGAAKPLTRYCPIGGARGARTVPAALIRALTELAAVLAEEAEDAAQRAAF